MTIIVTGGAGFIGSNFIFHMLKQYLEYRIICLDKLTYAGNLSTLASVMDNPNFRFVKMAMICPKLSFLVSIAANGSLAMNHIILLMMRRMASFMLNIKSSQMLSRRLFLVGV